MPRSRHQSSIRYPLTGILANETKLKLLRELARHGGALSAPALVQRAGLAPASVHHGLETLAQQCIVERLGSGRARLHSLRRNHPRAPALDELFAVEERRFGAILAAIREAVRRCQPGAIAVWLYGSVAGGSDGLGSDLDLAVVCEPRERARIATCLADTLRNSEERLDFTASVTTIDLKEARRHAAERDPWWLILLKEGRSIVGEAPEDFTRRLDRAERTGP